MQVVEFSAFAANPSLGISELAHFVQLIIHAAKKKNGEAHASPRFF